MYVYKIFIYMYLLNIVYISPTDLILRTVYSQILLELETIFKALSAT